LSEGTGAPADDRDGDFLEGATVRDGRGRNVRRILVRGVNAPLPPEAIFFENLTTKWCILEYI